MAFKSMLTVLTDKKLVEPVLSQGIEFARAADAHYDALCLGVDRSQTGYYYAGANAMILQETLNRARKESEELEAQATDMLRASGLRWGVDSGVTQIADIGRHVAAHARFADLAVLPKPYGEDYGAELEPVIEAALFEARTPVLVLPDGTGHCMTPKRVSIGWNESGEALSAVRAALPILKEADSVRVVVVDPPTHGPNRSDPGGLLSQFLSRHGVRAEIDVLSKTLPRVGDVLMRHARDHEIEMMVMGAYGHSRFREAILGGATRNMLEQADMPIFMAH